MNKIANKLDVLSKIILLIVVVLLTIHINKIYKKIDELKTKINQIELDYKFLEYNTNQLEELR